jgi:hypothetical protein
MSLVTGIEKGKKFGTKSPYVMVEFTQEFIDYIKTEFNRDCEIIDSELLIYPSLKAGKNHVITVGYGENENNAYVLFKFNRHLA